MKTQSDIILDISEMVKHQRETIPVLRILETYHCGEYLLVESWTTHPPLVRDTRNQHTKVTLQRNQHGIIWYGLLFAAYCALNLL